MSGSSTCKQCGRPIVWGTTNAGKNMPVDPEPTAKGRFELEATGMKDGRVVFAVRVARYDAEKRYRCHFDSCPKRRRS